MKEKNKFIQPTIDNGGLISFGDKSGTHLGKDYNAPVGTPVLAISDGEILWARKDLSGFGCTDPSTKLTKSGGAVVIKHRLLDGTYAYALYGHITTTKNFNENDPVKQGDEIGKIHDCYIETNNGIENVPHLHFGIFIGNQFPTEKLGYGSIKREKGKFVDPAKFLEDNYPYQPTPN